MLYDTIESVISSDFYIFVIWIVIELYENALRHVSKEWHHSEDTIEDTKGALQPLLTNVN